MPPLISSGRRSVLRPVSRLISDVLPWSMWPAVPISMGLQRLQVLDERRLVARQQAARVEPQRVVRDAAEHGNRERAQAPLDRLDHAAARPAERANDQRRRWQ